MRDKVRIAEKATGLGELWSPRIVAQVNDYNVAVVKIQGDFVWHSHQDTDELFLILAGRVEIQLRDRTVELGPGEPFVVPRGTEHCARSDGEATMLLFEPLGTPNTGDAGGERTVAERWI